MSESDVVPGYYYHLKPTGDIHVFDGIALKLLRDELGDEFNITLFGPCDDWNAAIVEARRWKREINKA